MKLTAATFIALLFLSSCASIREKTADWPWDKIDAVGHAIYHAVKAMPDKEEGE